MVYASIEKQKMAIFRAIVGLFFVGALLFPETSYSIAIGLVAGGIILFVEGVAEFFFLRLKLLS